MPAMILEGGTFRPIFSAGVMDALLDHQVEFPYCIGVSAGAVNACSYLSKQKGRNLEILQQFRHDKRYMGARNFLRCRSFFGLEFAFERIPNEMIPFDSQQYKKYQGSYFIGVTNAHTGQVEYKDGLALDKHNTLLKATCALPIYFPPIQLEGKEYYDGGIREPIPVRKAMADGHDKFLIVLTRPQGYVKQCGRSNQLVAKVFRKKYPNLVEPVLTRHHHYNQLVQLCEQLAEQGKAVLLRPAEQGIIESFERDVDKITTSYQYGYQLAVDHMSQIKALFAAEEQSLLV